MATTTRLALRYPVLGDSADVPRDIGNLAADIDKAAIFGIGTLASRPVSAGGTPGISGRFYYANDAGAAVGDLWFDFGTGYRKVALYDTNATITFPGGLAPGSYTTTQRDAIAAGFRPTGLAIYNTTTGRWEYNAGTDATPNWQPFGATSTPPSGPAGGDLTGTYPNPTIGSLKVTAGQIANDTITATQIAANAIGASELADNAVDAAAIATNAVTTTKIADANVTQAKLTGMQVFTKIVTGRVNGDGSIAAGSGFTVSHLGGGSYRINFSSSFSATPVVVVQITEASPGQTTVASNIGTASFDVAVPGASDHSFNFAAFSII